MNNEHISDKWKLVQKFCENTEANKWLKLDDREEVQIIVRGEPFYFYHHWTDGKKEPCQGESCQLCKQQLKPAVRIALNVLVIRQDHMEPMILETSKTLYGIICENVEEYGWNVAYKFKREGLSMNTSYRFMFKAALTPDQLQKMNEYELHDLEETYGLMGFTEISHPF